jgi:hypothetical protein
MPYGVAYNVFRTTGRRPWTVPAFTLHAISMGHQRTPRFLSTTTGVSFSGRYIDRLNRSVLVSRHASDACPGDNRRKFFGLWDDR